MNWGYKLMLGFSLFAAMMIYLVFRCFQTNFDLVEKEYYKSELAYQQVIDGSKRAGSLSAAPGLTQSGNAVVLQMPDEMKDSTISGSIWFYCAYDAQKDKKFQLTINENGIQVFNGKLQPGKYTVKMDWEKNGDLYHSEQLLTVL